MRKLTELESYSIDGTESISQKIILYSYNIKFDDIGYIQRDYYYVIKFLGLPFYGKR